MKTKIKNWIMKHYYKNEEIILILGVYLWIVAFFILWMELFPI